MGNLGRTGGGGNLKQSKFLVTIATILRFLLALKNHLYQFSVTGHLFVRKYTSPTALDWTCPMAVTFAARNFFVFNFRSDDKFYRKTWAVPATDLQCGMPGLSFVFLYAPVTQEGAIQFRFIEHPLH